MSHWQPVRLRYMIALTTSRIATVRGRPPWRFFGEGNKA